MPVLSGQRLKGGVVNRIQPRPSYQVGTGTVVGAATNADVPSASITVTTETAGARYTAECVWDVDTTSAGAASGTGRLNVDGANQSPLATFSGDAADRGTYSQNYSDTLPVAGSHTFKLVASPATGQTVQGVNCSIKVTIYEVV